MSKCLIFDADDTLWENNIYFERAIDEFITLLRPVTRDAERIRRLLADVEREFIPIGGYGSQNFIAVLRETFRRLYTATGEDFYFRAIAEIGERLQKHPVDVVPGVADALGALRAHFRLALFTKGDPEEQQGKLERSGLRAFFELVEIVPEKDAPAYRELIRRHGLAADFTFMVGNSPRSDVLPALAAGLWAIFVPHEHTWNFEVHPVEPHPRLLHAKAVSALPSLLSGLGHFSG